MTVSQPLPQGSFVLLSQKGGIFREASTRRRCSTVNPLSTMTESPLTNGKFRNPDLVTIFLSEKWPANKSWLTKGKAPPGEIPTNPFSVVWFLYELKSSLFIQTLRHLTADLSTVDDDPGRWIFVLEVNGHLLVNFGPWLSHWNFQNFKNIKLIHEIVIWLTVVCEILYRWLTCSS